VVVDTVDMDTAVVVDMVMVVAAGIMEADVGTTLVAAALLAIALDAPHITMAVGIGAN
jgi:hypothetical protein